MMVGEMTSTGDVAPVMTGAPLLSNPSATGAKRQIPTVKPEKQRKLRNRVAAGIVGQLKEDSRDGYVIPDDAKEVTQLEVAGDGLPSMQAPKLPGHKLSNPYSGEEPLIFPAASLVAPDVTPEAIYPLDASQLPGADRGRLPSDTEQKAEQSPVINTLLGKQPQEPSAPHAEPANVAAESVAGKLPGIPSPADFAAGSNDVNVSATSTDLVRAETPMPEHVAGDSHRIMEAFSRFVPRSNKR